jgi:DNA-binding SARP family transcriptional activator
MPTLRVQLFGKFCVLNEGQTLEGFNAHKVQELFCYLLLYRNRSIPREVLASQLWPETTTAQSKKNLRQTLWRLQTALDTFNKLVNCRVLIIEPDWVQLNTEADLWLDVLAFEQGYNAVQRIPTQDMDGPSVKQLQETALLYQGPLLEGWYQDWCLQERERFQGMYLTILDKLMMYYAVHHDYETSLSYGKHLMCFGRVREKNHRLMMRLYYMVGDREEALRQFERCAAALQDELGLTPSKKTIELYKKIQADQLEEVASKAFVVTFSSEAPLSQLLEIRDQISQLQSSLNELQDKVHKAIGLYG